MSRIQISFAARAELISIPSTSGRGHGEGLLECADGPGKDGDVRMPTLIKMKEAPGREQERIDLEHLRMRLEDDAGK